MSRVFGIAVAAFTALALGASAQTPAESPSVAKPKIVSKPIPFGAKRKREMRRYATRHYGIKSYKLRDPKVIVVHYTASSTFSSAYNTFASDTPDVELNELPGVCAHFIVDSDGTIYQLVPLAIMCRHTVGLNWTSIGIEHVGTSDGQVLGRAAQMRASIRLTRWLRCRYGIAIKNVIGHGESLSSPYHREKVARLKRQTHGDFTRPYAKRYRARLRKAGGC